MASIFPPEVNIPVTPATPPIELGANVLAGSDKPKVRITVEGQVGCAKTSILLLIHELLKDQVEVVIGDEYTEHEILMSRNVNHADILKLYSPVVTLVEKINPNL